ncbi:hypothetical protein C8Q70DRAFT_402359 [Cubamyces menziesii]|nr:hypothetical protein C8Q70DRAFT_402359 [Cubamyces menziesii]
MSYGSQPALTRTSTATGSEDSAPLVTPFDDFSVGVGTRGRHHNNTKISQLRGQATFAQYEPGGVHIRSPSDELSSPMRGSRFQSLQSHEDYTANQGSAHPDSYFAIPLRQNATSSRTGSRTSAPALSRTGTTKELIGRFESMDGRAGASRNRQASVASHTHRSIDGAQKNQDVTEKPKEKGRSPIRQSFRNLLSVFKKSKPAHTGQQQRETSPSLTLSVPGTRYKSGEGSSDASPDATHASPTGRPSLTLQIPSAGLAPTDPRNCISPISAHTGKQGPLLYLCRTTQFESDAGRISPNASADLPPVWMPCLAQLHTTHVLVSWQTSQGNPTSRLVPFTACSDVRSLALGELDPGERAVLPAVDRPDLRVFELLFEGRAREKFAVEGVTERAGWVSAIWDAVLLAQENRVRSPAVSECSSTTPPPVPELQSQPADFKLSSTVSPRPQLSATNLNRALPAVPPPTSERLDLRNLPPVPSVPRPTPTLPTGLSPLPAPPTTPTSVRGRSSSFLSPTRCDSPSGSRPQSPSIRNLDQRSVVKQRLAQIADSASAASARSSSPVSPSTRRWELRDSPRIQRQGSTASSGAASILNSYARSEMGSPRSMGSGRLTTQPPSPIGSPPPRMSAFSRDEQGRSSRFLGIPSRDDGILSLASQYSSNDDGGPLGTSGGAASQIRSALEALANQPPAPVGIVAPPAQTQTQDSSFAEKSHIALEKITDGADRQQGRAATDSTNIVSIRMKVDEVLTEVRRLQTQDGDGPSMLHGKLEDMEAGIKGDLTTLRNLLEGVKAKAGATGGVGTEPVAPEIVELHEKLDNLLRLYQVKKDQGGVGGSSEQADRTPSDELADVLALLKNAEEQRETQMEQQTDSIRYLHELNTWLEAFVKHGTSQIEGMAAGVQQLCKDLGPIPELQDATEGGDNTSSGSLLSDIRRFLAQSTEREDSTAVLHTSVNGLVAAVQEDLRRNAEARNLLTTESVVGMIDRQRQDQERMLRALATELSNDIRGERLRFVEAMKEATAINVQIHVEEFKKELTREVMLMTQEVTRLQRERQGLEQQIADLFAFYAKQKQAGKMGDVCQRKCRR